MTEETFQHTVDAWTVGRLRRALEGVPDDLPIRVVTAEKPGGDIADEQVVISGDHMLGEFEIGCEFPSGEYYRT